MHTRVDAFSSSFHTLHERTPYAALCHPQSLDLRPKPVDYGEEAGIGQKIQNLAPLHLTAHNVSSPHHQRQPPPTPPCLEQKLPKVPLRYSLLNPLSFPPLVLSSEQAPGQLTLSAVVGMPHSASGPGPRVVRLCVEREVAQRPSGAARAQASHPTCPLCI